MLTFENLTLENWPEFEDDILKSELFYPEAIRTSREEFIDVLSEENIAKIAKLDSRYIGNIMGYPLSRDDIENHGLESEYEISETIYLFNFVIDPEYQGKGHGCRLLQEFIGSCRERGYKKLIGHFRQKWSLPFIKKMGGREVKIYNDWEGSMETYVLCELELGVS